MEKNVIPAGSQPLGALATEDMYEGTFVLMTSHTWDENFGSLTDLPGAKIPDNSTEAGVARYVVSWTVPERKITGANPLYFDVPQVDYAFRRGFGNDANLPMDVTVHLTHPSHKEDIVIPSGRKVLLLGHGAIVTIPSGRYVYSAEVETPGARLEVLNSGDDGDDAGKLAYSASGTIAEVWEFNYETAALTVRIVG